MNIGSIIPMIITDGLIGKSLCNFLCDCFNSSHDEHMNSPKYAKISISLE